MTALIAWFVFKENFDQRITLGMAAIVTGGALLYELKRSGSIPPRQQRSLGGSTVASSASSLHAKTFSVDGSRVFIGSFNFDPRSARLNTEIGFIIESPALARRMDEAIEASLSDRAYRVQLDAAGRLRWTEWRGGKEMTHDREPGTGPWQRLCVRVLSWLPIDWLL